MKKILFTLLSLVLFAPLIQAQTLSQIIDAHHEIMGLEAAKTFNTVIMRGTASQMGMEFPITIFRKRTASGMKVRTQLEYQGMLMVPSAYNGVSGWKKMPSASGGMEVQTMTEEELEGTRNASFEGIFYQREEKGSRLTLLGQEEFEGTDVYAISIKEKDGKEMVVYLDKESYVSIAQKSSDEVDGQAYTTTLRTSDYDMIQGKAFPMTMETVVNGQTLIVFTFNEVLVNEPIDDALFEQPRD